MVKLKITKINTNLIIIGIIGVIINYEITCSHYIDQSDNFVGMFSGGNKSLQDEYFKIFEHITALATHDLRKETKIKSNNNKHSCFQSKCIAASFHSFIFHTSTNSGVSLNGELSKPRFFGEQDRINP